MSDRKRIFISYSYDNEEHEEWVLNLSTKIEEYEEFHVTLDKYDLSYFHEKNLFMEKAVSESDIIVIIASDKYVEKANDRQGGVGIETSMTVAKHFKQIEETGKSNIIAIYKSNRKQELPSYLNGARLRLNFDSSSFESKFDELIKALSGEPLINRPKKTRTLSTINIIKSFNTADSILSINYKNRKRIDYIQTEKVKYEYWECLAPAKHYFLTLFPNSNIKDSIIKFITNNTNLPKDITVLKEKESNTATNVFIEYLIEDSPSIYEYSYSKYLWELCIDQNFKIKNKVADEPNYIPQDIYYYSNDDDSELEPIPNNFIEDFINNDKGSPILMILATAGKGKTTLVEELIDQINLNEEKKCIYITSEDFKEYFFDNNINLLTEISTIYDLYNIHIRIDENSFNLDKNTFNIGLSNGNIVIILDGLDEIIALYQEKFKLDSFIKSLMKLNEDFGKCKILISSRKHYWNNNILLNNGSIVSLMLNGFDETHVKRYINKRFSLLEKKEPDFYDWTKEPVYKKLILEYINQVMSFTEKEMLSPFIVDIICTSVEIQLKSKENKLEISNDYTYPCNDEIIDKIIFSIFKREKKRQQFKYLQPNDIADIFIEIAVEYGETLSMNSLEYIVESKYESIHKDIISSLKYSQLLIINNNKISFKYDILVNYFTCLYILKIFTNFNNYKTVNYRHLSKLYKKENPIFKEVKKYFIDNKDTFFKNAKLVLEHLINKYKQDNIKDYDKSLIEQSIYSIIYILMEINYDLKTNKQRIDILKDLYNVKGNKIEYLFILDKFCNLDFRNMEIWNSKFDNYSQFLHSDFFNTIFYYSVIKNIKAKSEDMDRLNYVKFDESCELDGLFPDEISLNKNDYYNKLLNETFKKFYDKNFKQYTLQKKNSNTTIETLMKILFEEQIINIIEFKNNYITYSINDEKRNCVKKYLKEETKSIEILTILKKFNEYKL